MPAVSLRDEILFLAGVRRGCLRQLELAERLLELRADAVERRVRAGRDHRPDELEREPDRARLERRQPRRAAERVAEELLVDVHLVAAQLGVDRVAAAAEVDEVEQRQVLLELFGAGSRSARRSSAPGSRRCARRRRRRAGRRAATAARRSAPARPGRPDGPPRPRPRRAPPALPGSGAAPSCAARAARAPSTTSRRSSDGSSGIARPSWRRIQRASRPTTRTGSRTRRRRRRCARRRRRASPTRRCRARLRSAPRPIVIAELPLGSAAVLLDVELRAAA